MPITSPVLAIFIELARLGSSVHVGTRHRKLRRAEAVERMTEGVNAAALDVCNRAGRADLEIAAHERNANRITRAKRLWSRAVSLRERRHRGARHHGNEPPIVERRRNRIDDAGVEPPRVSGVAIGRSNVPRPALRPVPPKTWTSAGCRQTDAPS